LELADWCLRQGLPARAADQLLAAYALDPESPELARLERRLTHIHAAGEEAGQPAAARAAQRGPAPTDDDAPVPRVAVEYFTQEVQPVLLNRCATNACHGIRSNHEFRLMRPARGQGMTHRMTQRNLGSAASQVDRENPDRSPLLTVGQLQHGGLEQPLFGERDAEQLRRLREWVRMFDSATADNNRLPAAGNEAAERIGAVTSGDGDPPLRTAAGRTPVVGTAPAGSTPRDVAKQPSEVPPADPHDPEIFNRRYAENRDQLP
jgi:hypothetical protein